MVVTQAAIYSLLLLKRLYYVPQRALCIEVGVVVTRNLKWWYFHLAVGWEAEHTLDAHGHVVWRIEEGQAQELLSLIHI